MWYREPVGFSDIHHHLKTLEASFTNLAVVRMVLCKVLPLERMRREFKVTREAAFLEQPPQPTGVGPSLNK